MLSFLSFMLRSKWTIVTLGDKHSATFELPSYWNWNQSTLKTISKTTLRCLRLSICSSGTKSLPNFWMMQKFKACFSAWKHSRISHHRRSSRINYIIIPSHVHPLTTLIVALIVTYTFGKHKIPLVKLSSSYKRGDSTVNTCCLASVNASRFGLCYPAAMGSISEMYEHWKRSCTRYNNLWAFNY